MFFLSDNMFVDKLMANNEEATAVWWADRATSASCHGGDGAGRW